MMAFDLKSKRLQGTEKAKTRRFIATMFCFAAFSSASCFFSVSEFALAKRSKGAYSVLSPLEDASRKPLSGEIKHSEFLPPLKSGLDVGALYDERKLDLPAKTRRWYRVPEWLAGAWESQSQTEYVIDGNGKKTPGRTFKNHGIAHYGAQRDKNGGIWDFVLVPVRVRSEAENFINNDLTTEQTILRDSDQQLILKDVFTRRRVDKKNKKISQVIQMEQISSIMPAGKDRIELQGSLKIFDPRGKGIGYDYAKVSYKRISRFKKLDFDQSTKEDLRPSFYYYLKSHRLEDLLPDR